ncbi:uncharacterized protein LOC143183091 [Calliopsis andreniformis]|uniref:uncharacterized protein LOC143183091 n=1 Tax=Calliopsis andreniformis TaxID=337506 RepID=UPI003FCD00DF
MTRYCSAFNFLLTLIVVLQISSLRADNAVPVLLWDGSSNSDSATSAVNPFLKTSREEFDAFLRKKLENFPPVFLFVKDNLCIEDLMKHKQHLHKIIASDSLYYFPAVEKAVNVIEDLPSYNHTYNDYMDSISDKQLLIMPINNLDIIPDVYKTIKESSPNLIAILTGRSCSYRRSERVKRDTPTDNSTFVVKSNRVLLYSSQPLLLKISEDKDVIKLPLKPTFDETVQGTQLKLNLQFNGTDSNIVKHKLIFIFEVKSSGYYTLRTVNYEPVGYNNIQNLTTNIDIVFPYNFSYHCSHKIIFQKNATSLNITDLQVQIDPQVSNGKVSFSDAYDCIGFTTIPIWTGIFVTAILALIMIWGLSMIIDIRTMDRFDDPKGKTITISAQE